MSRLRKWDRRIERANELAARHPFAAEALGFYARIAGFQKSLYAGLEGGLEGRAGSLRGGLDLSVLLPWLPPYLSLIADIAPPPLARSAAELRSDVLEEFWQAGEQLTAAETLIAWTFLQPYAERLADQAGPAETQAALCPLCSRRPQVGVLRPLGDGAKRSLVCSLCATEWDYRRIVCPACGEESVDKLPVYVSEGAEDLDHVRVEACDTCRHYIKTVDLTKNGRAVPVVDELAAIPLSLWATENGYMKLSPNLLGL